MVFCRATRRGDCLGDARGGGCRASLGACFDGGGCGFFFGFFAAACLGRTSGDSPGNLEAGGPRLRFGLAAAALGGAAAAGRLSLSFTVGVFADFGGGTAALARARARAGSGLFSGGGGSLTGRFPAAELRVVRGGKPLRAGGMERRNSGKNLYCTPEGPLLERFRLCELTRPGVHGLCSYR